MSLSIMTGIVAAGTALASATQILQNVLYNQVATCPSACGVNLPTNSYNANNIVIRNDGSNNLLVYPGNSSGSIDALSAGAADLIAPGAQCAFLQTSSVPTFMSNSYSGPKPAIALASTGTVLQAQSGYTFFLSQAAAGTVALPSPLIPGLQYRFILKTAGANTIALDGGAGLMSGSGAGGTSGGTLWTAAATANEYCNFLTGAAAVGDCAILISDGAKWKASLICGTSGAASANMSFS